MIIYVFLIGSVVIFVVLDASCFMSARTTAAASDPDAM
jgi:hypothetical protein